MKKHLHKLSHLGLALAIVTVSGSTVLALPPQVQAHAQANASASVNNRPAATGANASLAANSQSSAHQPAAATNGQANGQAHMQAGQLKACQNRQAAVNGILSRIVTRGQNQLTLFNKIAQRVEAFKATKNLTVSNYSQLLATLTTDQTKATNDLSSMKTTDTLDCSSPNPKAIVNAFQGDLKTEINDLQTYRTDVKNLIVAVKSAVSVNTSTTANTSTGGKN